MCVCVCVCDRSSVQRRLVQRTLSPQQQSIVEECKGKSVENNADYGNVNFEILTTQPVSSESCMFNMNLA